MNIQVGCKTTHHKMLTTTITIPQLLTGASIHLRMRLQ